MAAKKGGPAKSNRKAIPRAVKRGANGKLVSRKK
jgi:hypothetical protein